MIQMGSKRKAAIAVGSVAASLAAMQGSARADAFNAGDLIVYRIGTGAAALSSVATSVSLDEYSTAGSLVQSVASPLTASGTASSEGLLTLSGNGQYLVASGYNAAVGTTGVASTTVTSGSTTNARGAVLFDSTGGVVNTTLFGTTYSGVNIRGATTIDGSVVYGSGQTTGIVSAAAGNTTGSATVITSASVNNRSLAASGSTLYFSSGTGAFAGVNLINNDASATRVAADSVGASPSPYQFSVSPDGSTIYVADDRTSVAGGTISTTVGGGIQKYTLTGGTAGTNSASYTFDYTIGTGGTSLVGARGLTVSFGSTGATIFATTAETAVNRLLAISDGIGTGAPSTPDNASLLATASANEVFRGVAFAPTAAPEPTSLLLGAIAAAPLTLGRRRRAAGQA